MKTADFQDMKLHKRGKVREVYELEDQLLIVASDRISAFDVVMNEPIPDKGKILTRISLYWFKQLEGAIPNHVITSDVRQYPEVCQKYRDQLEGRSMLVRRTRPLPVECIVRGYLSGSGWEEYRLSGTVCGIPLPKGLVESQKLEQPIFTPSTKAEDGTHDENISFDQAAETLGSETAEKVREMSLMIYGLGRDMAAKRGIIIADTKFEFGTVDDEILLIDEVMTPDSSRFWPEKDYTPRRPAEELRQTVPQGLPDLHQVAEKAPTPRAPSPCHSKDTGKVHGGP